MTSTTSRSKKVLVPLAVLLAAGALAVGSGATFTSASSNAISAVASGDLTIGTDELSFDGALTNLQPGDVRKGTVTLSNEGTLPAVVTLKQDGAATNTFVNDALTLEIRESGATETIYSGVFGGLDSEPLGTFAPDAAKKYDFVVKLDINAGNDNKDKDAAATFKWDAIQTNATQPGS